MARKTRKVRQYSFGANNAETGEHGTVFLTAKNADEAEMIRWNDMRGNADSPITCAGYVGPMSGSTWVAEGSVRGFVSHDVLQAEHEATLPEIDHDPAMLASFVADRGRSPRRGASLGHNLLNPNGRVIEVAHGTPNSCDPRSETYHSM
jgi:hypothetical protein